MLHGNLNFLFRLLFFSVDDLNLVTALLIISGRSIDTVPLEIFVKNQSNSQTVFSTKASTAFKVSLLRTYHVPIY